jgi:PemK-like, MazF-like toxin of type II toxin-antitoxin system
VGALERLARRVQGLVRRPRPSPPADVAPPGPKASVTTATARPLIEYAPARDGDADPGEVVWTWVPYEDDPRQGKDRPVLVIGRLGADVAALALTSKAHDDRHHVPIGTGRWDADGRPSWVKLDRLLQLDPDTIRREGAVIERTRFDAVVAAFERY